MSLINELLQEHEKLHFSLIDPDCQTPREAGQMAKVCEEYGSNAIMVGGSTVKDRKIVHDTIETIKENVRLPVILFPNSVESITENVEYIFFMRLMNSVEGRYRGEEQAKGAPLVKKWGIKPISMGYIVISTSRNPTTVEQRVELDRIHVNDIEKAVNYALYTENSGMGCVYLDAGSGAERPVSNEMIRAIRGNVDIPIIVGGGIRDGDTAREKIDAGADVIVTGTVVEKNERIVEEIVKRIQD
ncbi:MAG: geranylgeranylglyceryl/heptaprenylglyceryl phosphate synthase [Thermoplasmata archaeon]